MSAVSGDAAEQVVRMSLEGTEMAVKLVGSGAKQLAILLYAVLKDQKKTSGKVRLANMLRSGKELKVFAIHDHDLPKFCAEAKKYGVLFTVLKDRDANDGLTDIMVRAEDASKINRIFERFNLATVDMASVKTEIQKSRDAKTQTGEDIAPPERTRSVDEKLNEFLDTVVAEKENPTSERPESGNPTMARTAKSRPSEPSSESRRARSDVGDPERGDHGSRPSVKEELRQIRDEQRQKSSEGPSVKTPELEHIPVPVKKKSDKEVTL